MTHFIINIYDNNKMDFVREQIKFEGDLITAKKFSLSLARRLKLKDGVIYIYEKNDYYRGDDCLAAIDYYKK